MILLTAAGCFRVCIPGLCDSRHRLEGLGPTIVPSTITSQSFSALETLGEEMRICDRVEVRLLAGIDMAFTVLRLAVAAGGVPHHVR